MSTKHVIKFIVSTAILIAESLIMSYMGYDIVTWEWWAMLVLTVCYMLTYTKFD